MNPFNLGGVSIKPVNCVKLLGVYLDGDLSMSTQVNRTISSCFYQIRRLRTIRHCLPFEATKTAVNSFIVSRVDYCNGLLAGITQRQVHRLQSILNVSAKIIHGGARRDHVTPLLRDKLHWIRFDQRITYKLCLLVYKSLHGLAPAYLNELIVPVSTNPRRRCLRSADSRQISNPGSKRKFGERGFSVAGPSCWNNLPSSVRLAPNLQLFKGLLKTELFRKCYHS